MKLEPKHIYPYLGYGLNIYIFERTYEIIGISQYTLYTQEGAVFNFSSSDNEIKPLLRPLRDLTKDLYWELSKKDPNKSFGFWYGKYEGNNDKRDYIHCEGYSSSNYFLIDGYEQFSYKMMLFFFENHFDIFGLIEKGLAIDINMLKP